jgi:hypothetical protein
MPKTAYRQKNAEKPKGATNAAHRINALFNGDARKKYARAANFIRPEAHKIDIPHRTSAVTRISCGNPDFSSQNWLCEKKIEEEAISCA